MAELKPCPFCGDSEIVLRMMPWKWCGEELWECKCKQCAVRIGLQYGRKKAIEAWNRRAKSTPCDFCKFSPPSSFDGKPCTMCVAEGRAEDEQS